MIVGSNGIIPRSPGQVGGVTRIFMQVNTMSTSPEKNVALQTGGCGTIHEIQNKQNMSLPR